VSVVQYDVLTKIVADLTDKVKDHPLDVRSLELSSKLREYIIFFVLC